MEQTHQPNLKKEKKSPFRRWLKRIWNIIPSRQSLMKGIQFVGKKLLTTGQKCFQTCTQNCEDIYKRLKNSLTAFSSYQIKTPYTKANDCPLDELPIIIKVESLGKNGRFFHGAASYKDIVVDSNGEGKNTTKNAKMDDPEDTIGVYFVLYPQKMGLDPQKLLASMKEEASKENDYDFYINNCIDHVIRPLKSAGAQINFGEISTPKELCIWCDQMASQQKAGFVLNEEEYQKLLVRLENHTPLQKKELNFLYILDTLKKMLHPTAVHAKQKFDKKQMPAVQIKKASNHAQRYQNMQHTHSYAA